MKRATLATAAATALLAACQTPPAPPPASPPPAPAAPSASIAALYQRPAERALLDGIRLYEEASFERSEAALRRALSEGLADRRDQAVAYKYIAFISCAFNRLAECEACFDEALAADPDFKLNDKEIGHPIWGPVYRRAAAKAAR